MKYYYIIETETTTKIRKNIKGALKTIEYLYKKGATNIKLFEETDEEYECLLILKKEDI